MIVVRAKRYDGTWSSLSVVGHSSGDKGDVDAQRVCAAVSTLCMTLAAMARAGVKKCEDGNFEWEANSGISYIEFCISGFKLLADNYSRYITLSIR